MIAAHIKPRSECSITERKDPKIVMPLCKIECNDLFEKGYLLVEEGGKIGKNKTKIIPSELNSFMIQYEDKICLNYNQSTRKYFKYKRKTIQNMLRDY